MAKIPVKLFNRCLVDNQVREKDEIVPVDEEIAQFFGEPVKGIKSLADEVKAAEEVKK
jgi:hypothetical protein